MLDDMVTLAVLVTDELHLRECHFDLYRGAPLLRSFQFRYLITHDSVLSTMMPSLDMGSTLYFRKTHFTFAQTN